MIIEDMLEDIDVDALYIAISNYFGKNNKICLKESEFLLDQHDPDANFDIDEEDFCEQFLGVLALYIKLIKEDLIDDYI